MARAVNRLTARAVTATKRPGYYADGANLWLQVSDAGTKSWIFRFTLNGKSREAGLGSVLDVPLADARERARAYRLLLAEGIDPIEYRNQQRAKHASATASTISFDKACEKYIDMHGDTWKSPKHRQQWQTTLDTYCGPVMGKMPVHMIGVSEVMRVLQPEWKTKTETLKRLRGRIEQVLDWARVQGYRSGENPARWKGNLDKLLAAPSKVMKREHFAALPYSEIGAFMQRLREQEGLGARAVEFCILTAARSGEVRGATWNEIDLEAGTWSIPGDRMKGGRPHVVPLPKQAVKLLQALPRMDGSNYVFPAARGGMLSDMTLSAVLRRMKVPATVHGMRSTFSTWTAETTSTPTEVREACLAHVSADRVSAAYQRGDFMTKRALHMQAWADYCDRKPAEVVKLPAKRRKGA